MNKTTESTEWINNFEKFFDEQMRDEDGFYYGETGEENRTGTEVMEEFKIFIDNLLESQKESFRKLCEEKKDSNNDCVHAPYEECSRCGYNEALDDLLESLKTL